VLNQVELTWSTATETNNDFFTVEKSNNGTDFKALAQVPGAGNSNQILNYKLIDEQPYEGVSYYRLKQTDFDGKYTYSELRTVSLNIADGHNKINIYPNPSNLNGVYVALPNNFEEGNTMVQLIDIHGKVIYSNNYFLQYAKAPQFINLDQIANGIYTIKMIQYNGEVSSLKISLFK
jgi:hypothetical protein